MKVALIGATGRTGRLVLAELLSRADLATFLVHVLEQHLYPRQAPFVWAK